MDNVIWYVDRKSFPKKCPELDDFLEAANAKTLSIETESPTEFFRTALELTDEYELVIPVTRNLFVRDRLRQEGVSLVVCL